MLSLNSDRYLEYQMAVPWGGGVLNPCNIRWSAAEILYSLDDWGRASCWSTKPFARWWSSSASIEHVARGGLLRRRRSAGGMHGYEALLAGTAAVPDVARRGEDLAGIFYTGGTTGFPKA